MTIRLAATLLLVWSIWSGAVNPATGERQLALIGEGQEIQMGRDADQSLVASMGMYGDQTVQAYVDGIGRKLAAVSERPSLPWTFRVMDDPIVNAFALPGGFVYITRGILVYLQNEAELAEILGHEIGHVTARHSVEQISRAQLAQVGLVAGVVLAPNLADFAGVAQGALGLLFLKFGRDDERQADDLGLRYSLRSGYDPRHAPAVFRMLDAVSSAHGGGSTPEWLSTHPNPENRAERLQAQIDTISINLEGRLVGEDALLQGIDNMVYGVNPREGFFRDELFLHPELRFQIRFPNGWQTSNQKQAVLAVNEQQNAIVQLTVPSGVTSADGAAAQFLSQEGVTASSPRRTRVNNLPAVTGAFSANTENGVLRGEAVWVEYAGAVFQILGFGNTEGWNASAGVIRLSLASFAELTDPEALNVQPQRIDIVTIRERLTLVQFSARYPSVVSLDELVLLNRRDPDTPMAAGTKVKRVVS